MNNGRWSVSYFSRLTSHVSRLTSHDFSHLISHFSRQFCTSVPACFSQGGRSGFGCVSLAFRSRFACKWNAELTISKRVIGIFRPRFACLQNSLFPRILTAETQRTRGCKNQEDRYRLPAFSGSKSYSLTVVFLPASLRISPSRR